MTDQDPREPVRPDVWRGAPRPSGSRRLDPDVPAPDASGRLDPALDPDRYAPDASGRLDPALDPDRYVADPGGLEAVGLTGDARGLNPAADPDRYRPGATGPGDRTLTELLGEGAQEESRDSYVWLAGLLAVLLFLFLVSLVARNLGP